MILIYRNVSERERGGCDIIYESWVIYVKSSFHQLFLFLVINNVSHKKRQKLKQTKKEQKFLFLSENGERRSKLSNIRVLGVGLWLRICCKESKLLLQKTTSPLLIHSLWAHTFCVIFRPHFLCILPFFLWNYLMSFACTLCLV